MKYPAGYSAGRRRNRRNCGRRARPACAILLLVALAALLLAVQLAPSFAYKRILLGTNTRAAGNELIFLQTCAAGSACAENATLGKEFGRAVYGVQVADLDADGLNETSVYAAASNTIGQTELTTYACNSLGCRYVASESFDLPYGGVAVGDKQAFGDVDNSGDGVNEWVVGQSTFSANAGRQEVRVFRCGTNDFGWYAQNVSENGTVYNFTGATIHDYDLAFIVGMGGAAFRWDGAAWNWESLNTTNNTLDIDCAKSGEAFCFTGGQNGFLAYWNGTPDQWFRTPAPAAVNVNHIYVYNKTFAMAAVGNANAVTNIWRWNGSQWSTMATPSAIFYGVSIMNGTYAQAVGSAGNIALWNGTTWVAQVSPLTASPFLSIDVWNSTLAFAVTNNGQIIRYTGAAWSNDTKPTASALSRVRFYNSSKAVAIVQANGMDEYGWSGGAAGTWAQYNWTMPRYATYNDIAIYNGTADMNFTLAVGYGSIVVKYGNDTAKCAEDQRLSNDYYSAVANVAIADLNQTGKNALVATAATASTTTNNNEFMVWNCTGGQDCRETYSTNHDGRAAFNSLYIGDADGDTTSTEVIRGMTATTNSAGTCAGNELCVMRCNATWVCTNCGAACMINTGYTTYSIRVGTGLEKNYWNHSRIAVSVDRGVTAADDVMVYRLGSINNGTNNTLTLSAQGLDDGTGSGAGQTVAYGMDAVDYYGWGTDQLLATWAFLSNYTFGIYNGSTSDIKWNYSSVFNSTVANYVVKYHDVINEAPLNFTAGPSDGGSDQAAPTLAGTSVAFTGTATTFGGGNWRLLVCDYPFAQKGDCDPWHQQICKSSSAASSSQASCTHDTTGEAGNYSWFAFACDAGNSECSPYSSGSGAAGRPYFVHSAPSTSTPTVSPASPTTGDNLTCNATLTDDFDPAPVAIVSWFKNGTNQTSLYSQMALTNGTNSVVSTVLSGNLSLADRWICSVQPYDGFALGTAVNSTYVQVGSYDCGCSSCATCAGKLNDPSCPIVNLTAPISGVVGSCINNPAGFSSKTFDCLGNQISGDDSGTDYGIRLVGKSGNTIRNCRVRDFYDGITLTAASDASTLFSDTSFSNTNDGISIYGSSGANATAVNASGNAGYGIYLSSSALSNVSDSTASYNAFDGIVLGSSTDNYFRNNTAHNNTEDGFWLTGASTGNLFLWNNASYNRMGGFAVDGSDNNTFLNNTAANNTENGFRFDASDLINASYNNATRNIRRGFYYTASANGTFRGNNASYNGLSGTELSGANYSNLSYNILGNNSLHGALLGSSGTGNALYGNALYNNTGWDLYVAGSPGNSFVNNTVGMARPTTFSLTYSGNFSAREVASPPADPGSFANASRYVNVTNLSAGAWVFLNVSYLDSDLGGYSEPSVVLAKHNGSWWTNPPSFSSSSGVETSANYAYANVTMFGSVFSPLVSTVASSPPQWRNAGRNVTSVYAGDTVKLYAEGNDTSLGYAVLSTNETGAWTNYTGFVVYLGTGGAWTYSNFSWRNDSAPSPVYWRIWYNDTTGAWNATDVQEFSVYSPAVSESPSPVSACGTVYYRAKIYNASDALTSSDLNVSFWKPSGALQGYSFVTAPQVPAGVYNGSYLLPFGAVTGTWTAKAASSGVSGTNAFDVGSGGSNVWSVLIGFSPVLYSAGENVSVNFTVYSQMGEGIADLAHDQNMSVLVDSASIPVSTVQDKGLGNYNFTYNTSALPAGSHYFEVRANSSGGPTVASRKGFSVS